ncbi:MAG: hypothetical protein Q4B96_05265 [Bacillota bacterium]|nr:hypothetical protein [Bacillota bacterium]
MSARSERIAAALAHVRGILDSRAAEIREKDELLAELRNKFERLDATTFWAELDSGKSIAEGAEVRYFGKYYRCIKAHTKALLRSPLNEEYWQEIE